MFIINDTPPAAKQQSCGEPVRWGAATGGRTPQTLFMANSLKKGQRHHVPGGKNKNKDKDLCIQIFMLVSNIVGQWQATLAIKYELTQKGTFSFLLFSQLSHLHRETFYPLCSPAPESDRPGNSSVGIKVPILLPTKSKAKFPLCQGSQLISCKLGWAVRASFPKQANAFLKRQLGVYCIITWPLRG